MNSPEQTIIKNPISSYRVSACVWRVVAALAQPNETMNINEESFYMLRIVCV